MPAWIPGDALVALAAAASWGGGDFSGGMAVKAAGGSLRGAVRVVIVAHAASLAVLLLILRPAALPHGALLGWGLAAGVAAATALSALYLALARGAMGASTAVSGVLAAAIPAVVARVIESAPGPLQSAGFVLAAASIWIIAAAKPAHPAAAEPLASSIPPGSPLSASILRAQNTSPVAAGRRTLPLAVLGGVGFGMYFVALRMDNPLGVLEPLALARVASLVTCTLVLALASFSKAETGNPGTVTGRPDAGPRPTRTVRRPRWLTRTAVGWALAAAVLDTGGDLLFVEATRLGRLDVAAVLASFYPAGTILLAAWLLRERPTRRQLAGMAVALLAVALITG